MSSKKTILSGIQPSGELCIANQLGAINNWVDLQDEYQSIFLIVDLHSLTVQQVPSELRQRCLSFAAQYIACGINPNKSIIAIQSHIHQHAELAWVLSTLTSIGELNRMTQFKDKSKKHVKNINTGLFTYPILMASDILIYNADLVPVGADQKQHLELSRNLAERFNYRYSDTFTIPEPYISESSGRIMSLQEPSSKMSKSDVNKNNFIALIDDEDTIIRKIKRAVTDSGSEIVFSDDKPGLKNLITIYSCYSGFTPQDIEDKYAGKMYSDFKKDLGELISESLKPIRDRYNEIICDKEYLNKILLEGAQKAAYVAQKTISKVYRKVGLIKK
ncbi:MAG: tryptophan--tRNA ligase [Candidatus Marinimicrobia bacterium]|nr:tryptophan--tRNA ligase [Candidatus Neomarinimicrobiota bacterium]|tara:strand:+ start:1154 stop:2149 length:996 start_codon:yes stop_codon:yes gene_type:complete